MSNRSKLYKHLISSNEKVAATIKAERKAYNKTIKRGNKK